MLHWSTPTCKIEFAFVSTKSTPGHACLQSFAAWRQHREDLQLEKAVTHDTKRHSARALTAWKLGMAIVLRKCSLIAAAKELVKKHRQQHSLSAWMRYTYYKHLGHVALHFRVRRLACIVLRKWQEVRMAVSLQPFWDS